MATNLNHIREELFNRGLEIELKPLQDGEYQIYPYPISMHEDLIDDPIVLDWIAHQAQHMQVYYGQEEMYG